MVHRLRPASIDKADSGNQVLSFILLFFFIPASENIVYTFPASVLYDLLYLLQAQSSRKKNLAYNPPQLALLVYKVEKFIGQLFVQLLEYFILLQGGTFVADYQVGHSQAPVSHCQVAPASDG